MVEIRERHDGSYALVEVVVVEYLHAHGMELITF